MRHVYFKQLKNFSLFLYKIKGKLKYIRRFINYINKIENTFEKKLIYKYKLFIWKYLDYLINKNDIIKNIENVEINFRKRLFYWIFLVFYNNMIFNQFFLKDINIKKNKKRKRYKKYPFKIYNYFKIFKLLLNFSFDYKKIRIKIRKMQKLNDTYIKYYKDILNFKNNKILKKYIIKQKKKYISNKFKNFKLFYGHEYSLINFIRKIYFFKHVKELKHLIHSGNVYVNGTKIRQSNMKVKKNDIIFINLNNTNDIKENYNICNYSANLLINYLTCNSIFFYKYYYNYLYLIKVFLYYYSYYAFLFYNNHNYYKIKKHNKNNNIKRLLLNINNYNNIYKKKYYYMLNNLLINWHYNYKYYKKNNDNIINKLLSKFLIYNNNIFIDVNNNIIKIINKNVNNNDILLDNWFYIITQYILNIRNNI